MVGVSELALVLATPQFPPAQLVSKFFTNAEKHCAYFFFVGTCSANTSTQYFALNSLMKRGSLGGVYKSSFVNGMTVNAPKLARDPQVLTAAHQRIAFARLGRSGDARRVEVLLLPARDRDQAIWRMLSMSASTVGGRGTSTHRPIQINAYSLLTTLGPTFVGLRGASPHAPGPNALLSMRRYLISGR